MTMRSRSVLLFYMAENWDQNVINQRKRLISTFFLESCKFVKDNLDSCEGGGYVLWTEMILCESDDLRRVIFIVLAVLALLYLFIMISTSADDFFSTNIANIVDEHNISQVSFAFW